MFIIRQPKDTPIGDSKRAMKRTLFAYQELTRKGFAVGGWNPDTGGSGYWKPRVVPKNPKNIGRKRIRKGGKVLINTGRLKSSIVSSPVYQKGGKVGGFVGTNAQSDEGFPYPIVHQFGATQTATAKQAALLRAMGFSIGKGTTIRTPRRPIFVMPEKFAKRLSDIYAESLTDE